MAASRSLRYEFGYPTINLFAARDAMQVGVDKPTGNNTGIVSGFSRTVVTGDTTITATGDQSWYHYDFYGRLKFNSSGQKYFRNCRFFGNSALTTSTGAVDCTNSAVTSIIIEDSTFFPGASQYNDCIIGWNYTLRRCNLQHGVDGCGVNPPSTATANGVTIEMCYFDNFAWFNPSAGQSDGSHSDGIQIQGGSGASIRGNYFNGYFDTSIGNSPWSRNTAYYSSTIGSDPLYHSLSNIQITPNISPVTGCTIDSNWCFGAEIGINASKSNNSGNNIGTITNNRFGHDQFIGVNGKAATPSNLPVQVLMNSGSTWTASGNVFDDTSAAITFHSV